jgi:hypothetical protein
MNTFYKHLFYPCLKSSGRQETWRQGSIQLCAASSQGPCRQVEVCKGLGVCKLRTAREGEEGGRKGGGKEVGFAYKVVKGGLNGACCPPAERGGYWGL